MNLEYEIPKPLVFKIADPLIIYKGNLFQTGQVDETLANNYFDLNGLRFELDEIETPKRLEDLLFKNHAVEFERIQQQYIQSAIRTEYQSREQINSEIRQNKILHLLITKVLPNITNHNIDNQISRLIEAEQGLEHQDDFLQIMARQANSRGSRASQVTQPRRNQREVQRQQQELIRRIKSEYRQFESHSARTNVPRHSPSFDQMFNRAIEEGEGLVVASQIPYGEVIQPNQDGSILNSHIFPERNLMIYANGIHDLVSASDWISFFSDHIDSRFYERLERINPTVHPDQVYDLIKDNLDKVNKEHLSRLVNKFKTSNVRINGEYFFPVLIEDDKIEDIEKHYQKLIEKQVKLQAIEHSEYQAIQMLEITRQRESLSQIANLTNFELNGAGYEKRGDSYMVYVKTPKFALRSPHNGFSGGRRYLEFPEAKIGVSVSCNYDNRISIGDPIVMNNYRHPFLPDRSGGMKTICLGNYSPHSARRHSADRAIMELLSKAKENIMMGYRTGGNPYPQNSLKPEKWEGWITKRQVEQRGLVCLNEY